MIKPFAFAALAAALLTTAGCQSKRLNTAVNTPSTPITTPNTTEVLTPVKLDSFSINGKIGITMPATEQTAAQGGSAFYVWAQQNERFAIELIGALGIGKTNIEYDGQTATLLSEKTGTITANTPEELLQKATGWQVPISQLPYWLSGHPTPTDTSQNLDNQGRLQTATNNDWTANFSYADTQTLPNKIVVNHTQGYKVVMTINHQN